MSPERKTKVALSILLIMIGSFVPLLFGFADSKGSFLISVLVYEIVLVALVFLFLDRAVPVSPVQELNFKGKLQKLWTSASFWMFLVLLIGAVAEIFWGITISEEDAKDIIELDWNNIVQAVIGVVGVVFRKQNVFPLMTPIKE